MTPEQFEELITCIRCGFVMLGMIACTRLLQGCETAALSVGGRWIIAIGQYASLMVAYINLLGVL